MRLNIVDIPSNRVNLLAGIPASKATGDGGADFLINVPVDSLIPTVRLKGVLWEGKVGRGVTNQRRVT